jgi:hypothetical protein
LPAAKPAAKPTMAEMGVDIFFHSVLY